MSESKLTLEEAVAALDTKKADAKTARLELKAFMKEHKIKEGETPEDEKLAKKLNKLADAYTKAQAGVEKATEAVKGLKPKAARATTYEYPEGMSAAEKKKFRSQARAAAKKAAKAAEKGDEPAKEKKSKKSEPEAEAPAKDKKKKKQVEDED